MDSWNQQPLLALVITDPDMASIIGIDTDLPVCRETPAATPQRFEFGRRIEMPIKLNTDVGNFTRNLLTQERYETLEAVDRRDAMVGD
jgi:hypothetical protein